MEKELFFKTHDNKLRLIKFYANENQTKKSPLVVFFFGGGWLGGDIDQFKPQALEFIKCGYVCACVDYRVYSRDNVTIDFCMKDAFFALKYLGDNAGKLNIDSDNVFLSGGSAGGHIALSCEILNNVEISLKIKGLFLFNPVTDTTKNGYQSEAIFDQAFAPIMFSPYHHIKSDLAPVLIMHGTDDTTVSHQNAVDFVNEYKKFGNKAKLISYQGCNHGFFNLKDGNNPHYFDTLEKVKTFIKEQLL